MLLLLILLIVLEICPLRKQWVLSISFRYSAQCSCAAQDLLKLGNCGSLLLSKFWLNSQHVTAVVAG